MQTAKTNNTERSNYVRGVRLTINQLNRSYTESAIAVTLISL